METHLPEKLSVTSQPLLQTVWSWSGDQLGDLESNWFSRARLLVVRFKRTQVVSIMYRVDMKFESSLVGSLLTKAELFKMMLSDITWGYKSYKIEV